MRLRLAGQASAAALLIAGGTAMAETKLNADANLSGGYASNPYGETSTATTSTGSATLNGALSAGLTMTSPTGLIRIGGSVSRTEYFKRYGGTTDYNASLAAQQQLSALTSVNASLGFMSQFRNGLFPAIDPNTGPSDDPNDPVIVDPDAGASFAQRTESLNGNAGISFTISPRDSLSVSARGALVRYPRAPATGFSRNFDSYGGGFSYMRSIGADTSLGIQFDVNRVDYANDSPGSGSQYSPSAVLRARLAPRLTLNANAGVTFSETELLFGKVKETSLSGSIGLCHGGDRANLCANASRRVAPSSFSGTSTVTSFAASYNYRLSPRDSLGANISYSQSRSLAGFSFVPGNTRNEYGQVGVSYSRQILQRLFAVASISYSDSYGSFVQRDANVYGSIGVRYSLGDLL